MSQDTSRVPIGPAVMAVGAIGAVVASVLDYLIPASGVAHTGGALLVVGSSACLLVGAILEMIGWIRAHWTGPTITVLLILDIVGTAVAAYFLEAWWLEAALVVTFAGWLAHVFMHRTDGFGREGYPGVRPAPGTHELHGARS